MLLSFRMENQEELRKNIANNIANYRKMKGYTQSELADKLNYSDKSVSKWERGESIPDVLILKELANFFEINVDDFFLNAPLKKKDRRKKNLVIIPMLGIVLAWLVAATLFTLSVMVFPNIPNPWLLYIYAVPASGIIFTVFMAIYRKRFLLLIGESIIIWGVGLSIFLTTLMVGLENVYLFWIICVPLQVLAILYFILKTDNVRKYFAKKKNKQQVKENNEEEKSDE